MYDFDHVTDRRNTGSYKWDVAERELPMWVADMDFQTAPEILEAIEKRAKHGVFGYTIIPNEWNEAYSSWWGRRHHFPLEKEKLIFCTGVVPAISSMVRKLTTPNENVLIQTPVYNIFFNSILNNGCRVLESPLVYDGKEYHMDLADLEKKLSDPQTTLMILCNPQNPVGKIWDREILKQIGALCTKYHVTVISDEIHCDLADPGKEYVPFAGVSGECAKCSISCLAPTKTFNIAGLQTAAVYVPDDNLRHKVWRGLNTDEVAEPNAFAITAAVAAFRYGEAWLDELRQYIFENKKRVTECVSGFATDTPIYVVPSDCTYLMWLDVEKICRKKAMDSAQLAGDIRRQTGLYLCDGMEYGTPGRYFLRMNVACPKTTLEDGLQRLKKYFEENI